MSNKPNVIVLDFNGALFPKRFVFAKPDSDPVLVNIIKVLCEQYNFRIVISSLMSEQGIDKCKEELERAGVSSSYLLMPTWSILDIGLTTGERHSQIERWYNKHKDGVDKIIIFDDEYCPMLSPISEYWYRCDEETGINIYLLHELCGRYPEILN